MKLLTALLLAFAFLGCSKGSEKILLPSPLPAAGVVCQDMTGKGPNITLTPPGIQHQLKDIDGCFRGGRCFYNCGKKD